MFKIFFTTFHLSMSSCCSLRCRHSPPSSCENDCRKSSSEICNHLKSYYFTPKDSSTSRTTWSKSDPTPSVCQSQQEQNISTNSGHFPAGSSSVEIKATCWRIPIDPFQFDLWTGNNFLFLSSSAETISVLFAIYYDMLCAMLYIQLEHNIKGVQLSCRSVTAPMEHQHKIFSRFSSTSHTQK